MNEHVDKLCSKVNRSISGLKQARDYVPSDVLNTIYKSLIQPVFDYCDVVWDNFSEVLAIENKSVSLPNECLTKIARDSCQLIFKKRKQRLVISSLAIAQTRLVISKY